MSRFVKSLVLLLGVVGVLLLLRIGAAIPASILGFILFVVMLVEHLMYIRILHSEHKRYNRSADGGGQSPKVQMSEKEAREILGVDAGASAQDIKKAHRDMIARNHPDKGGSKYLAARINEAKDVLLKKKGKKA